jgi:hypothetical protein
MPLLHTKEGVMCPLHDDLGFDLKKNGRGRWGDLRVPCVHVHYNALMKNFVDHLAFLVHRPRFFQKLAMIFIHRGGMVKDSIRYMERVAAFNSEKSQRKNIILRFFLQFRVVIVLVLIFI